MTKRKQLSKSDRLKIYEDSNGKCQYCGKQIELKEMQVDHIQSFLKGGECTKENFRCACRQCNFYKSTFDVEQFREELTLITGRLRRDSFIFRLAIEYGLIKIIDKDIMFEFEKGEQ